MLVRFNSNYCLDTSDLTIEKTDEYKETDLLKVINTTLHPRSRFEVIKSCKYIILHTKEIWGTHFRVSVFVFGLGFNYFIPFHLDSSSTEVTLYGDILTVGGRKFNITKTLELKERKI